MTQIKTRAATKNDIPALAELFRQQVEHQRTLSPRVQLREQHDCAALLASRMNSPDAEIFVAEMADRLIGYISVRLIDDRRASDAVTWRSCAGRLLRKFRSQPPKIFEPRRYGFIEDWYVLPDERRQGIAKLLWQASLQWFQQRNAEEVEATVSSGNEPAQQLFQQLGFQPARVLLNKQL